MHNPDDDDFDPNEPDVFGDFDHDMKEEKNRRKSSFIDCHRFK